VQCAGIDRVATAKTCYSRNTRSFARVLAVVILIWAVWVFKQGCISCERQGQHALVTVQALYRYAVKSCAGEAVPCVELAPGGVVGDRSYAVCLGGSALTQRNCPRLAAIQTKLCEDGSLQLSSAGASLLTVPDDQGPADTFARILGGTATGIDLGDEAGEWVSTVLGVPCCRLVKRHEGCPRRAVGAHWADLAPLLVISEESLTECSRRAGREVPVNRFRPNIVVRGCEGPHAEDGWRQIRIGNAMLQAVGPCARCSIVEVDQKAAATDRSFSVFGVLAGYREAGPGQVTFGQYFSLLDGAGSDDHTKGLCVEVDAEVEVLQ